MDRYDKAIAYLSLHPDECYKAWLNPTTHPAGCLFLFATPTGDLARNIEGWDCGCLTQIRAKHLVAWTKELTDTIRHDERLPINPRRIKPETHKVFAEWQRKLDAIFPGRNPEETNGPIEQRTT